MRAIVTTTHLVAAMTLFLVTGGCGDAPPPVTSSSTEATVKGTVRVDGKPATDGEVVFDASNINRPNAVTRKAQIGKDGSYSTKTLVGENVITLQGEIARTNPFLQRARKALDVKDGENSFDMDFSTK